MSLQDVVEFVRQDFVASGCLAPVFFGAPFLEDNAHAQRIVVVPTTDRYTSPQGVALQSSGPLIGANPRPYWTRFASFEVHIWAAAEPQPDGKDQLLADYGAIDRLLNQTVMSFYKGPVGTVEIDGGDWKMDTVHVRLGLSHVLKLTIQFPIVDVRYGESTTYQEVSGVEAEITVEADSPGPPPGTLGSVTFSTS